MTGGGWLDTGECCPIVVVVNATIAILIGGAHPSRSECQLF